MLKGIECLGHSTIRIQKEGKIIYIDPYDIKEEKCDADIIFITHSHYDHYSENDIKKVRCSGTKIVVTQDLQESAVKLGFSDETIITVKPNCQYCIEKINFTTVPAYNTNKKFHQKESEWVGYILEHENKKYYISGDTDITPENRKIKCDVAFIPVGGTYTMDFKEAAQLINEIKPNIAVPIHYGKIVGSLQDAEKFKELLIPTIECKIMIK